MAVPEGNAERLPFLQRWTQEHLRVLVFSLGKLARTPVGSLLMAAVIGVTLALPAGLHVLVRNLDAISYSWEGTLQASLFLRDSVSETRGQELSAVIGTRHGVAQTRYISRAQSLAEFREMSGFGEAIGLLQDNPLPAVIVASLRAEQTLADMEALVEELGRLPEVEQAQLDQRWLERLYAMLDIVQRAVLLLSGLLALAVIVIVGNSIRLEIENRREEIVVMKLVGASDGFIRRPFLYTGFWYGFGGSVIALLLVGFSLMVLAGPASRLADLYGSAYRIAGLGWGGGLAVLGGGIMLGWAGAWWTVARHLSQVEPR